MEIVFTPVNAADYGRRRFSVKKEDLEKYIGKPVARLFIGKIRKTDKKYLVVNFKKGRVEYYGNDL